MKYFKVENNRKVVKPDLPDKITILKDTRKEDWIDIYIELGFILSEEHFNSESKLDYLMDLRHLKDGSLRVRHWHNRGTHHIMPLRTIKKYPLDREYKKNMIEVQSGDCLSVALETILDHIRSMYRGV